MLLGQAVRQSPRTEPRNSSDRAAAARSQVRGTSIERKGPSIQHSGAMFSGLPPSLIRRWQGTRNLVPRVAAAAASGGHPDPLATAAEVEKALKYEAEDGCINLQGQQKKFNEFVAAQFSLMDQQLAQLTEVAGPRSDPQALELLDACSRLSQMFASYPSLVNWRRRELVRSAINVTAEISKLHFNSQLQSRFEAPMLRPVPRPHDQDHHRPRVPPYESQASPQHQQVLRQWQAAQQEAPAHTPPMVQLESHPAQTDVLPLHASDETPEVSKAMQDHGSLAQAELAEQHSISLSEPESHPTSKHKSLPELQADTKHALQREAQSNFSPDHADRQAASPQSLASFSSPGVSPHTLSDMQQAAAEQTAVLQQRAGEDLPVPQPAEASAAPDQIEPPHQSAPEQIEPPHQSVQVLKDLHHQSAARTTPTPESQVQSEPIPAHHTSLSGNVPAAAAQQHHADAGGTHGQHLPSPAEGTELTDVTQQQRPVSQTAPQGNDERHVPPVAEPAVERTLQPQQPAWPPAPQGLAPRRRRSRLPNLLRPQSPSAAGPPSSTPPPTRPGPYVQQQPAPTPPTQSQPHGHQQNKTAPSSPARPGPAAMHASHGAEHAARPNQQQAPLSRYAAAAAAAAAQEGMHTYTAPARASHVNGSYSAARARLNTPHYRDSDPGPGAAAAPTASSSASLFARGARPDPRDMTREASPPSQSSPAPPFDPELPPNFQPSSTTHDRQPSGDGSASGYGSTRQTGPSGSSVHNAAGSTALLQATRQEISSTDPMRPSPNAQEMHSSASTSSPHMWRSADSASLKMLLDESATPSMQPEHGSANGSQQLEQPSFSYDTLPTWDDDLPEEFQASLKLDNADAGAPDSDEKGLEAEPVTGKRSIKPETLLFRANYAQAAAQADEALAKGKLDTQKVEQRSSEWHSLRSNRLTASSFCQALGFFPKPKGNEPADRIRLWEEKLRLREPFKGNLATMHGNRAEAGALAAYERLSNHSVSSCGIQMLKDADENGIYDWLAGSPDGLIEVPAGWSGGSVEGVRIGEGPGVLEIKCPYSRNQPYDLAPYYYMPQVQGLMEIFKRKWCNLYCWTSNGSAVYHIVQDPQYWGMCWEVLAEFWWCHVKGAERALNNGGDIEIYRPKAVHPRSAELLQASKVMAQTAPTSFFDPMHENEHVPGLILPE